MLTPGQYSARDTCLAGAASVPAQSHSMVFPEWQGGLDGLPLRQHDTREQLTEVQTMATDRDYQAFMAKANAPLAEAIVYRARDGSNRKITDLTQSTLRRNQYAHITEAICLLAGKDPTSDPQEFHRIFWGRELKQFRQRISVGKYDQNGANLLDRLRGVPCKHPQQLIARLWESWWCHDCTGLFGYAVHSIDPRGSVRVGPFLKWCELNDILFPPRGHRRTTDRDARLTKLLPLAEALLTKSLGKFRKKDGKLMVSRLANAIFDAHGSKMLRKVLGLPKTPVSRTLERYLRQLESQKLLK